MGNIDSKAPEQLQRAVALIKSGDKPGGQRLLTELLAADPRNEQAWLWMSTVVSDDKRRYCLEKAVSINPDNVQARQALARLSQAASSPPASSETPKPQPSVVSSGAALTPDVKPSVSPAAFRSAAADVWMNRRKYYIDVSVLTTDELIVGRIGLNRSRELQDRLKQGQPILDLLDTKDTVPLKAVSKVTLSLGLLYVSHSKGTDTERVYVPCPDEATAKVALDAIQQRLGPGFERTQAPIRTCMALGIPTVLMVVVMAVTGFLYWGAREAAAGATSASARTRGILALLELIGPNGVLCIGGVFLLLCIVLLVRWGLKPPLETILTRKDKEVTA